MANCNIIFHCKKTWIFYVVYFLIRILNKKWVYSVLKNCTLGHVYHNGGLIYAVKVKDMQHDNRTN